MTASREKDIRLRIRAALAAGTRAELDLTGYQRAAVLIPLITGGDEAELLFTKRTESVETHKGQISFPGGVADGSDEDPIHTALREAEEEVGIRTEAVEILGVLDDVATPTGFVITPVVGALAPLPALRPNPDEVAEVFRVPFRFFEDPAHARSELRRHGSRSHEVWYFETGTHTIWGVTAVIIRSLLGTLHKHEGRPDGTASASAALR